MIFSSGIRDIDYAPDDEDNEESNEDKILIKIYNYEQR